MKEKHAKAHMRAAYVYADLSYCQRRKVGCVVIKHDSIIAIGYNGPPSGEDNICEDTSGNTKPNVIHAEDNALRKLTRRSESAEGSIVFVTTAPCVLCASRLVDAGVSTVYYDDVYRNTEGIEYLKNHGVEVFQLPTNNN